MQHLDYGVVTAYSRTRRYIYIIRRGFEIKKLVLLLVTTAKATECGNPLGRGRRGWSIL